jgi:fucose permease
MLAVSLALAAFATTPWFLACALSLAGAASGVACDSAQAELITRHPVGAAPAMTRWLAFAAAGDALVPLVIAAVYWAGGTHRSALSLCALLLAAQALAVYRNPVEPEPEPDSELDQESATMPLRAALAQAARKPRLWLFLFGASACTLLDEVVVALAALRLHQDLGWTESEAALVMTGLSSGAVLGALVSERLLQTISSRRLLVYAAAGSCILLAIVVAADSAPVIVIALFCLGVTCALHWPLVKAAAYELVPGQPGVVNALQQAFVGMDIALPLLVGLIASHFGLATALASLATEPIILLVVAAFWRAR